MYSEDSRQKEIFHIKEEVGLWLGLVVGREDVEEEVAEVVSGGGGEIWWVSLEVFWGIFQNAAGIFAEDFGDSVFEGLVWHY